MLILGLETTCDETAAALVVDGKHPLSHVVASQADLHANYGGVFPELAARGHLEALIPVIDQTLRKGNVSPADIDLIAVARGPGLIGALLIGLNGAKSLSLAWKKPFVGVNHVEAHLYAAIMGREEVEFPALGVVLSGGHTFMAVMEKMGHYQIIGATVDDALGEAFDKVARLLGLPYPGGPHLEKLALQGDASLYSFKPGRVKKSPWNFSFSGLKTHVLYTVKGKNQDKHAPFLLAEEEKPHIAAAFQEVALRDVASRAISAVQAFSCRSMILGGGVTQNRRLRELLSSSPCPVYFPPPHLSVDNGVMIAALGYWVFARQGEDRFDLEPLSRFPLHNLEGIG